MGGTGKAITASLKNYGCKNVTLTNRTLKRKKFAKYVGYKFVNFHRAISNLESFDLIINATSAGFLNKNLSPINVGKLSKVKDKFFFDVIYQPKLTLLLKSVRKKKINFLMVFL